jgi:hypothetical protein
MGEKWPRILPKVATSTSLLGSFTCRKARHGTDGFSNQFDLLELCETQQYGNMQNFTVLQQVAGFMVQNVL